MLHKSTVHLLRNQEVVVPAVLELD